MGKMKAYTVFQDFCARAWVLCILLLCSAATGSTLRGDWHRRPVDWRVSGGGRVRAIYYPEAKPPPTLAEKARHGPPAIRKKQLPAQAAARLGQPQPVVAAVIDSPPVDGFVPWIAVLITDARGDELELDAVPRTEVIGNKPAANPQTDYAIGIFDTGASASVMSYAAATAGRLFSAGLVTDNQIEVTGVTGSAYVWVSQPLGLFIDGLGALELDGRLVDTSLMVGETNVSIGIGDAVDSPNLPTAIGTPLSVYFAAEVRNDRQVAVIRDGNAVSGPDIRFYDLADPALPGYPNLIPLELRPLGGVAVQYIISLDDIFDFSPGAPSVIIGQSSQSIFFLSSVDLYEGNHTAYDKSRFMLDTGAQISVIGSRIAARLGLNPANEEFEVEIQGVTGDVITAPGFYVDKVEIPALGEWLSYTNVPVVLLDIPSPEGGTVDGIIGMNLFLEFNFLLNGSGLPSYTNPTLEFGPIPEHLAADFAPRGGDGVVDLLDLAVFIQAWLATAEPVSENWDARCDLAPAAQPDGRVNLLDLAVFAENWQQ
jgi:hypothetical protein